MKTKKISLGLLVALLLLSSCYTIVRDPSREKTARSKPETEQYTEPDYSDLYRNYPFYYQPPYPYYYNRNWFYDNYWSDYYFYNRFYRFSPYRSPFNSWYGYGYYDPFYSYYNPYGYYYNPYNYYGYYDYWGSYYYPYGYYPYGYYRHHHHADGSGGTGGSSGTAEIQFARPGGTRQRETKSTTETSAPDYLSLPMSSTTSSGSHFAPGAGGTSSEQPVIITPTPGTIPEPQPEELTLPRLTRDRDVLPVIDGKTSGSSTTSAGVSSSTETPHYLPPVREKEIIAPTKEKSSGSRSTSSGSSNDRQDTRTRTPAYTPPPSHPTSQSNSSSGSSHNTQVSRPATTQSAAPPSNSSHSDKSTRSRTKK